MKRKRPSAELTQARGWALRLNALVERALEEQPGANPDKIRHKLIQSATGQRKGSPKGLGHGRASAKTKASKPRNQKPNGTRTNRRGKS